MASARPTVLIFSHGGIDGGHGNIKYAANTYQAEFCEPTVTPIQLLEDHPAVQAIWIVDHDIMLSIHKHISDRVVNYAGNGGTVILGGWFSSTMSPRVFSRWMEKAWNLPWRCGEVRTATVFLRDPAIGPHPNWQHALARSYHQKSTFLKNVSPTESWYTSVLA
ncbi:hypothetical protein GGS23DRAFT_612188 [Durotheca rogersii]|uniref:uncharacterized protein n=1 Tax=Durotheca rogersii TaxID=419775 RepID=UPI00221F10E5|nr:uncharacterized protein GGS23DRAFT_612188 [Durotheca rogersii]KAI5861209.1 hypothetical protein GGS23DRAFT_612188 [Durotheca rogersii]